MTSSKFQNGLIKLKIGMDTNLSMKILKIKVSSDMDGVGYECDADISKNSKWSNQAFMEKALKQRNKIFSIIFYPPFLFVSLFIQPDFC